MSPALLAILSALAFAVTFLFRKQAVRFIPVHFAFLIESILYFVVPLIIFSILPSNEKKLAFQSMQGIFLALLAGVFVVIGVGLNYFALKDGFLSKVISITSPAQILFGIVLGIILLKENLTVIQLLGAFFSILGVVLLTR